MDSMLEEAAGTRLFEQKKEAALKTIEKKSRKVDEISAVSRAQADVEACLCACLTRTLSTWPQVLEDEISPKLDKLRGERANYMKVRRLPGRSSFFAKVLTCRWDANSGRPTTRRSSA